jgi:hypothetical protein
MNSKGSGQQLEFPLGKASMAISEYRKRYIRKAAGSNSNSRKGIGSNSKLAKASTVISKE